MLQSPGDGSDPWETSSYCAGSHRLQFHEIYSYNSSMIRTRLRYRSKVMGERALNASVRFARHPPPPPFTYGLLGCPHDKGCDYLLKLKR